MLMNLATGRVVVVLEVLVFISSDHGVHPNLLTFAKLRLFLFVWRQIGREIVDHYHPQFNFSTMSPKPRSKPSLPT